METQFVGLRLQNMFREKESHTDARFFFFTKKKMSSRPLASGKRQRTAKEKERMTRDPLSVLRKPGQRGGYRELTRVMNSKSDDTTDAEMAGLIKGLLDMGLITKDDLVKKIVKQRRSLLARTGFITQEGDFVPFDNSDSEDESDDGPDIAYEPIGGSGGGFLLPEPSSRGGGYSGFVGGRTLQ